MLASGQPKLLLDASKERAVTKQAVAGSSYCQQGSLRRVEALGQGLEFAFCCVDDEAGIVDAVSEPPPLAECSLRESLEGDAETLEIHSLPPFSLPGPARCRAIRRPESGCPDSGPLRRRSVELLAELDVFVAELLTLDGG